MEEREAKVEEHLHCDTAGNARAQHGPGLNKGVGKGETGGAGTARAVEVEVEEVRHGTARQGTAQHGTAWH